LIAEFSSTPALVTLQP